MLLTYRNTQYSLTIFKQELALWHTLYRGRLLIQKLIRDEELNRGELITLHDTIARYRSNSHGISWFIRNLNEYIAQEVNKEDDCTGRLWERWFKSQALLDESAVLAYMAYVDLTPIETRLKPY